MLPQAAWKAANKKTVPIKIDNGMIPLSIFLMGQACLGGEMKLARADRRRHGAALRLPENGGRTGIFP